MPHVLVVGRIRDAGTALLDARDDITYEMLDAPSEGELLSKMPATDGILLRTAKITAEMISAAPRLKVVSRHGVGYDNVDVEALNRVGVPLAISATANMISVAEHALFLMFDLAKRGVVHDRAVRAGNWGVREAAVTTELYGKTLLVVGFGRVGQALAERAIALGMKVLVVDPIVSDDVVTAAGCRWIEVLANALPEVDFVSIHVPLTAETEGLFGREEFAAMKPGSFIVNTARGGIIDEAALVAALDAGEIGGAGLDVFAKEPPAPGDPLFGRDDVILSPHAAGVTFEAMTRMAEEAAENTLAGIDGRLDPAVVVNREVLR